MNKKEVLIDPFLLPRERRFKGQERSNETDRPIGEGERIGFTQFHQAEVNKNFLLITSKNKE